MERPKAQHISDQISEDQQYHVVRHNIEDEVKHDAPTYKKEREAHEILLSSAKGGDGDDRHATSEKIPTNNTIKPKLLQSQAKSSSVSSRALESSSSNTLQQQQQQPYFYYQNSTSQQQYFFALHSHPPSQTSLYSTNNNYGTTLTIIILLHIVYFIQWNKRYTKKQVSTNYTQIINKKQYYKVVLALGSHPSVDGGERDTNNSNNNSHHAMTNGGGGGGTRSLDVPIERNGFIQRTFCPNCTTIHNTISSLQRIVRPMLHNILYQRIIYPIVYGHLSGLPLLTFVSHILWSCRALEELYDEHDGKLVLGIVTETHDGNNNGTVVESVLSQFAGIGTDQVQIPSGAAGYNNSMISSSSSSTTTSYLRVLIALALTSLLIELTLLRSILKRINYDIPRHDMLRHRPICTMTSLTIALLGVYDAHFPFVPPPILPFVRISFLSSSGFSLIISIMILTILSHRIHSLTSIVSGLLSGSLWTLGITSFLATKYCYPMLGGLGLCILLSLKAQSYYGRFMDMCCPCIDYVAWDDEGDIPDGLLSHRRSNNAPDGSLSNNSDDGDLEMGDANNERFPLLSSQSSSMSSDAGGSNSAIRGRVPLASLQSDIDEDEGDNFVSTSRNNNEESTPMPTVASSSRFGSNLSRRSGGGSGVQ